MNGPIYMNIFNCYTYFDLFYMKFNESTPAIRPPYNKARGVIVK